MGTELQKSNWPLALVVGLPTLAVFELRWMFGTYQDFLRWQLDRGVPSALFPLEGYLLLLVGALLGGRLASGRGEALRTLGLAHSCRRGLAVGGLIGMPCVLLAALVSDGPSFPGVAAVSLVVAPVAFEAFFRGLLVAIPVRLGGKRFWSTAVLAGLLFGTISVPWESRLDWGRLWDFCVMTAEGTWLAWLVRCYGWNLWVTIGVIAVIRAPWTVFGGTNGAGGSMPWPDLGLGASFVLGTGMALRQRRKRSSS